MVIAVLVVVAAVAVLLVLVLRHHKHAAADVHLLSHNLAYGRKDVEMS